MMNGTQQQTSVLLALATENIFSDNEINDIKNDYLGSHKPLIRYLIEDKNYNAEHIAKALSHHFGYPLLDLTLFSYTLLPTELISPSLIKQYNALPLFMNNKTLFVAMSDPTNIDALKSIQFHTKHHTELVLTNDTQLKKSIKKLLNDNKNITDIDVKNATIAPMNSTNNFHGADNVEDAPIVIFINNILQEAVTKGASDLHFEPYDNIYRIRCRVDGILQETATPPYSYASRITARLKILADLDIADRRVPQDGRYRMKLSSDRAIDFRVSTLPTIWGEKIVLRILDSTRDIIAIDKLGFSTIQQALYHAALQQPQGMILVTGPTGSGKTVSLYTGLSILNTHEINISTVENPVEINIKGINQVQINNKANLTFPQTLRSLLRQDPDVIMVGEIRDTETAKIAIKAAQTGHLVLSTLHTNSASETLARLINIGIPAYDVASTIKLIIAQRLARRLCSNCKTEEKLPKQELLTQGFSQKQIEKSTLYKAVGCHNCTAGYRGRIGIYQVVKTSDAIARLIMENASFLDIEKQYNKEGYNTLRQSGLEKVALGITSLEEINRVTGSC